MHDLVCRRMKDPRASSSRTRPVQLRWSPCRRHGSRSCRRPRRLHGRHHRLVRRRRRRPRRDCTLRCSFVQPRPQPATPTLIPIPTPTPIRTHLDRHAFIRPHGGSGLDTRGAASACAAACVAVSGRAAYLQMSIAKRHVQTPKLLADALPAPAQLSQEVERVS